MCEHSFCYFHARIHTRSKLIDPRELRFSVPEDFTAIQESIAKVLDGIVNESIGPKQSSSSSGVFSSLSKPSRATPRRQSIRSRKSRSPKRDTSSLPRLRSVLLRSKQGALKKPCPPAQTSIPQWLLATFED